MASVEIILNGRDNLDPAFANAAKKAQDFKKHAAGLGSELKISGIALRNLGTIGADFGNSFSVVALQIASASHELKELSHASKSGFTALGGSFLIGIAAGWESMKAIMETQQQAQERWQAGRESGNAINVAATLALLDIEDAHAGKVERVNAMFDQQIRQVEKLYTSEKERTDLYQVLENLKGAQLKQIDTSELDKYAKMMDQVIQLTYTAQGAEQAAFNAERLDHQERLRQIGELAIETQASDNLLELAKELHEARITQIEQEQSAKRVQLASQEASRKQQILQATLSATSGLFGAIATLAGAQGKKGFAVQQAFRYAETIVNTAAAIMRTMAELGPIAGPPVAAIVAAMGAVQLATIASAKPLGQAHAGMDYVPSDGSFILKQGEMVLDRGTSNEVREMAYSGGGGGGQMIHVEVMIDGRPIINTVQEASRDGRIRIHPRSVTL